MDKGELDVDGAVDRILRHAGKVRVDDLNWNDAANVGLSDDEVFIVSYFADVESQTLANLKTLLAMRGALEPEMAAFLTTWSYEEYFHGHAFARLLRACGCVVPDSQVLDCHQSASVKERLERVLMPLASYVFAREFPAVYMTFGAIHELTTLRGYERLGESTKNPVLKELSARIAKQERRHFAFYFNQAQRSLAKNRRARWLTRLLLRYYFAPVGAGLKGNQTCLKLYQSLFPGALGTALCAEVDGRIRRLPGLSDLAPMTEFFTTQRASKRLARLPAGHRLRSRIGQGADAR